MESAAVHTHEAEAEVEVAATAEAGVQASLPRESHHAVQHLDLDRDQLLPVQDQSQRGALHQGNIDESLLDIESLVFML